MCKGEFRTGVGSVTVESSDNDKFTIKIVIPGEEKPIEDSYTLDRADMTLSQVEIGGYRADKADSTGLLITIPLAEGKARVWKVNSGLKEANIYDHVDLEDSTICNIVQAK